MFCSTRFTSHRTTGRAESLSGIEMRSAREHAWLRAAGRVEYREVDEQQAQHLMHQNEELLAGNSAIENGRALALAIDVAAHMPPEATVLLQLAAPERLGGEAFSEIVDEVKPR